MADTLRVYCHCNQSQTKVTNTAEVETKIDQAVNLYTGSVMLLTTAVTRD